MPAVFLSESGWDVDAVDERRLRLFWEDSTTKPHEDGVLIIDETGDRKDGKKTAHVVHQYLSSVGRIANGIVSVSNLWADEGIYYPLHVAPYDPAERLPGAKSHPALRTKPQIGVELLDRARKAGIPFRAVVADSFYGEDEGSKQSLSELGVGYVMALKPSHAWWHPVGEIGSPWEAAVAAGEGWEGERHPGDWVRVMRRFRDGHEQEWWALEVDVGPYGPQRQRRAVVATTDPKELPDKVTWYLATNLPHPTSSERSKEESNDQNLEAADLSEIVSLYGLRMWVEQNLYENVKPQTVS